ncbi:MAG: biotin--[acetyl-CoA-carboxylase] ligase [Verrucomicrobiota bacterium]|nr:biotin--[acetyl-CoA-carboxylase] ligase [Verrucomicrobiota bacterium]
MLQAEALRAALGNRRLIGNRIIVLEEATSTNDVVWQKSAESAEGLVIFAERQTAGRGQRGNRWESASEKGLWFSILLRPQLTLEQSPRLTSWAAESIAQTLRDNYSLGAKVKSPNDVYVEAQKVAGVLLEMRAVPNSHVGILGLGINVNQRAEDFPTELRARVASIAMLTGGQIDRQALAVALLSRLDQTYAP